MNKICICYRRLHVFFMAVFTVAFLLSGCKVKPTDENRVDWVSSTETELWTEYTVSLITDSELSIDSVIRIDPARMSQTIDGFGGCFNEMGWEALNLLEEGERQTVLFNLFDTDKGCKFTICRMPLGANDYSVDWYSHNETPGDYAMDSFSIDRDRMRLIPYIRSAREINPAIKIWASPWCPPSWMKTNQHYACRADARVNDLPGDAQGEEMVDQFILDERTLDAYALYFSRFLHEYQSEGIPIYAVHVQNELNSCQNFPSCVWRPESMARFIGQYLGPRLEADHPEVELWLGTIERPNAERVDSILGNEVASPYIKGVGFQWAGKGAIAHVHENYPELKLMQTETECGDGSNDWAALEHTFGLMQHYFNHGANAYMYWNMVLDHTGSSQWGWKQNAMITITGAREVVYNPEFFLMKHFSAFVESGALFVKTEDNDDCLAFLNPDNELIIVFYNRENEEVGKTFCYESRSFSVTLQPRSINTFRMKLI